MRAIKASLKLNKNGRLYCTVHKTYKVSAPPKTDCKICWTIYENVAKQVSIDNLMTEILDRNGH